MTAESTSKQSQREWNFMYKNYLTDALKENLYQFRRCVKLLRKINMDSIDVDNLQLLSDLITDMIDISYDMTGHLEKWIKKINPYYGGTQI